MKQTFFPSYHPQTNGLGERAVQTVKKTLNKFLVDKTNKLPLNKQIKNFLFHYRNTPSTVINRTPNSLIFNYKTKSVLNAINPYALNIKLKSRKILKPSLEAPQKSLDAYKASQKFEVIGHREKINYRNHFKNEVRWILATYIKPNH